MAEALQAKVRAEYHEPDALVYADNVEALGGNALSTKETDKIIGLLCGTIAALMKNEFYDGYKTVRNLGRDIVYSVYANRRKRNGHLTSHDVEGFSAGSEYVSQTARKQEQFKHIGF